MGQQMACCVKESDSENNYNKKQKRALLKHQQRNGPSQQMMMNKTMSEEYYKATGTSLKHSQEIPKKSSNNNNMNLTNKTEKSTSSNQISEKQLIQNRISANSQITTNSGDDLFYSIANSKFQSQISNINAQTSGNHFEMTTNYKSIDLEEQDSQAEQSYNEQNLNKVTFGQNEDNLQDQNQSNFQKTNLFTGQIVDSSASVTQTEEEGVFESEEQQKIENIMSEKEQEYSIKTQKIAEYLEKNIDLDSELTKWKTFSKKGTLIAHICSEEDTGMFACRVEEQMRISDIQQFIDDIYDFEYKKKVDGMFEWGKTIEEINKYTTISQQQYKGVAIVAARDVVVLQGKIVKEDGTIIMVGKSIEDDRCPEQKSPVRAECEVAGWHVSKLSGQNNMYKVIYISKINAKGKIPMYIKKGTAKFPIDMVKKIKQKWEKN